MIGDGASVLVQRRRLVAELKKARIKKGETQGRTAQAMEWSLSKVQRIEKGTSSITTNDLRVLLQFYGITDKQKREQLLELGREARKPPWWQAYRTDAPRGLITLIEYESVTAAVRQFETLFIPGILQTEEYARAVLEGYYNEKSSSSRISALVQLRTKRRELLDLEDPPQFHFVLDEPAVRRVVGSNSVMRQQLLQLIEVSEKTNVTVLVIPFTAGLHPGMNGQPFEIIEVGGEVGNDVVFEESSRGDTLIDDPGDVRNLRETFERLERMSLGLQDSVAFLREVADEMK